MFSGPGKRIIGHKHGEFVCFFFSWLKKQAKLCLLHVLWPLPALQPSLCQIYHHPHHPMVDPQAVWISQFGLCQKVGEGKQLPILVLAQTVFIKKPLPKKQDAVSFSHPFPPVQVESTSLCLTRKWIQENVLLRAILQCWRGMSVRDQLFSVYIFYYSASQAWFFYSTQPNAHLLVTDHQSKLFTRVHLLFRVWNKFQKRKKTSLPPYF